MQATNGGKECSRCHVVKALSEFGRDRGRQDGLTIYCRRCRREKYAVELGDGKIVRDGVVVRPPPRTATCTTCGNEFRPRHRTTRFCSYTCAGVARRSKTPQRPRPYISARLQDRQPRPCEHCERMFTPRTEASRFCSVACKHDSSIGTRRVDIGGYVRIRVPRGTPGTFANGWMPEHRYVMQQHLGRALEKHETIHHRNGDKADNRIENLQLRVGKHGKHVAYRCRACGSHDVEAIEL